MRFFLQLLLAAHVGLSIAAPTPSHINDFDALDTDDGEPDFDTILGMFNEDPITEGPDESPEEKRDADAASVPLITSILLTTDGFDPANPEALTAEQLMQLEAEDAEVLFEELNKYVDHRERPELRVPASVEELYEEVTPESMPTEDFVALASTGDVEGKGKGKHHKHHHKKHKVAKPGKTPVWVQVLTTVLFVLLPL